MLGELTRLIDYYFVLGVGPEANQAEIKSAYRRAALANHPDRGGDAIKMKAINAAYEVLGDLERRAEYDQELARTWWAAQTWAQAANRRAAQPPPPPPPPPWVSGRWQAQTARRPPKPAPAPWRYWPVRLVLWLAVAVYCWLAYSFVLDGPWGLLALIPVSGWYVLGAAKVYDAAEDLFLR